MLELDGDIILEKILVPNTKSADTSFIALDTERLLVATNVRAPIELDPQQQSIFEIPKVCHRAASTAVFELDRRSLAPKSKATITNFRLGALELHQGAIFVGGELLDGCSQNGVAAVVKATRLDQLNERFFWREDDVFAGKIKGIKFLRNEIILGISRNGNYL